MKNSSSKQRKNLLQKTSSKELLKSTLCLENANGWHKLGMKPPGGQNLNLSASLKNSPIPVFKASELDRNPIWQSCKLKIKIPLMKMNSEDLPTPQYSQKSPKKARKRKDSIKKAAASTSNHSSPTKSKKPAKKGRKRKASNLHNTVESKAKKVKRSSLSEGSPSSPALSAAAAAGWAASRSPAGWAGGSPAAGSSSPAGISSPRPPALKRKQSVEESLTCPTCDKLFIAKSILERHLKKSQHGMFEKDKDLNSPPPMVSLALDKARAEGQQLPHFNEITQPKIEVNGTEMNKYECHLCNKMFFRVKDLAKHRERMMCSAFAEYK